MTDTKIEVSTVKPEVSFYHNDSFMRIINIDEESKLDNHLLSIKNFMETTNGIGKSEEQKDMDYHFCQELWKSYRQDLQTTRFNFYLNRSQYNLLSDILLKKLEYDVDSLFIAIDLTDLLASMSGTKYQDENELKFFRATATETTFIYHLIKNFKVKGLTREAYTFAEIVKRIADISKIVSYYDANAKNISEDIGKWALSLDANPEILSEIPERSDTDVNLTQSI